MQVALEAQSQSLMTVATLAAMKNPPVVFAKQANIASGHQQVNNLPGTTPPLARAEETHAAPSKLLEEHDVERLDSRAQGAPGGIHKNLAAVGAVDRS